jgi:hypothetical protein
MVSSSHACRLPNLSHDDRVMGVGRRAAVSFGGAGEPATGTSVDRLAVHPLDEVVGRERPHHRGVPGEFAPSSDSSP